MTNEALEILENRVLIFNQNIKLGLLDKMDKQTILENQALELLLTDYKKLKNKLERNKKL